MKIPFDIKYRPQIESGEYKVETRDGRKARIIHWDLNCTSPIVAVMDSHIDIPGEIVDVFSVSGMAFDDLESPSDLFIVTPEEEMTEFEKACMKLYNEGRDDGLSGDKLSNESVKESAAELLTLAREELFANDTVLKEYAQVSRKQGKAEALKDLPRWNESRGIYSDGWIYEGFLYYKNHSIQLSSLEKLPGFKED